MSRRLIFAPILVLAIGLLASSPLVRADDDDDKAIKEAQKDTLDLAKAIEGGKDGKDIAAKMKKKFAELGPIMQAYKPRAKKGIGIGPKSPADGIEAKIISLGRRATADAVSKQKGELIKMAYINLAIAEVTKHYPPKPKGGKGPKEWQQYSEDLKKASRELIDAVKAGDAKKVKNAAANISTSCNNCHSDFRDS
jgi:cytochrome c556